MSDLDPIGPSQPTLSKAYTTLGNPVSKQPAESYQTLGKTVEDVGRQNGLDGEQIAALGEGTVRYAVEGEDGRKGASGRQDDLAADIEEES